MQFYQALKQKKICERNAREHLGNINLDFICTNTMSTIKKETKMEVERPKGDLIKVSRINSSFWVYFIEMCIRIFLWLIIGLVNWTSTKLDTKSVYSNYRKLQLVYLIKQCFWQDCTRLQNGAKIVERRFMAIKILCRGLIQGSHFFFFLLFLRFFITLSPMCPSAQDACLKTKKLSRRAFSPTGFQFHFLKFACLD